MYRMLFALPLFVLLAWWAGRGQPTLTRRDWIVVSGLGFSGYYLASFLDFAGLAYITRGPRAPHPLSQPDARARAGRVLFKRRVARAARGAGGQLLRRAARVRARGLLQGANVALGAALVFASAVSYALYLVYSGEEVQRLGALRLTGLASSVACLLCIAQFLLLRPLVGARGGAAR